MVSGEATAGTDEASMETQHCIHLSIRLSELLKALFNRGRVISVCSARPASSVLLQNGIVSFGPKPCDTTIPTVFTRVAGYR